MNIRTNESYLGSGFFLFIVFTLFILYHLYIKTPSSSYGHEKEIVRRDTVEIKQNLGGLLICYPIYYSNTWDFEVEYTYKVNNKIIKIGKGYFEGRSWDKEVQLRQYGNWIILKTGAYFGIDKIIISNLSFDVWNEYVFSPNKIEEDTLWNKEGVKSVIYLDKCCEAYIDSIKGGQILLQYKFRTDPNDAYKIDKRSIHYQIDKKTGNPMMVKITK